MPISFKSITTLRKFILISIFLIAIQLFVIIANDKFKHGGIYKSLQRNSSPKKILIWNKYWKSEAVWNKIFYEIIEHKCPISNCILTSDRDQLNTSDAVLIHLIDLSNEDYAFPQWRNPNQLWIAMSYEPPYVMRYSGLDFTKLNGIFNWTMSYRSDADIIVKHGSFHRFPPNRKLPHEYLTPWVNSEDPISERDYSEGKKRLVAWFASSHGCKSQSKREDYAEELRNYIPVDIYGACGHYKCGQQKTMRYPYKVEEDECYMLLSKGYKFVLAFENSLCKDYVTEKLYNHLKLNIIPIVLGSANYSVVAPPNSIIDASNYTPRELAEYLLLLDSNPELYNEYFAWKKDFYIESHDGIPMVCDLCGKMHSGDLKKVKVYDNMEEWLQDGCTDPKNKLIFT